MPHYEGGYFSGPFAPHFAAGYPSGSSGPHHSGGYPSGSSGPQSYGDSFSSPSGAYRDGGHSSNRPVSGSGAIFPSDGPGLQFNQGRNEGSGSISMNSQRLMQDYGYDQGVFGHAYQPDMGQGFMDHVHQHGPGNISQERRHHGPW